MSESYLIHHGILGQKWGVRRYQNSDGSLTSEGRSHYGSGDSSKSNRKSIKANGEPRRKELTDEQKAKVRKILKVGATAVGVGLAAYGTYKIGSKINSDPVLSDLVSQGKNALRLNANIVGVKAANRSNAVKSLVEEAAKSKNITSKADVKESIKNGIKNSVKSGIKNAGNIASKTAKDAGVNLKNTAIDMAITGLTVKAIKSIESSIPTETGDQKTDFTNKVLKETAKKTVNDASNNARASFKIVKNGNYSNQNNNSQPSKSQAEIASIIGSTPKGHDMVDNNTPEWGQLLNSVPKEKKQIIKDARRLGYDWDELHTLANRI